MPTYPIQIKRSGTAASAPSSLAHGELALNYADKVLYFKDASNVITSFTFQSYALASHTHAASDITSGTLDIARIPTGSTSSTVCIGNDARLSDTRTPTDNTVSTAKIQNDAVTYAKIQNVSATDRILGRSSAGAGDVEEITCTSFGRSLIDDADAAAARTTLSVQPTASPAFTGAATFANTGDVVPLTVTNAGTANSFVVNDASGDTSPFVIDASGRVGIGTGSPGAELEVADSSSDNDVRINLRPNGSTLSQVGASSTTTFIDSVGARSITFLTDANTRLTISSTGTATFAGQVLVTAGSGSSGSYKPGLAISGDDDTGVMQTTSGGANTLSLVTNGTERVRVDASGNVGIGTQSPDSLLSISGSNTGGALNALSLNNTPDTAGNGAQIRFLQAGNLTNFIKNNFVNSAWSLSFGTTSEQMRLQGGELIVGTTDQGAYNLQCNGTGVWGAGAYTNGSDARIKDDIAPLSSCTDVIESLRPVTFRYKESWSKDQSIQPGFIAQDLQQALAGQPYLDGVVQQGTEYLSVAYQTLIPLLVKALQESNARIAALEERING